MPDGYLSTDPHAGTPAPKGLLAAGTVDLSKRPRVKNADGSISTVRSISINQDGKEILIPTVVGDRVLSNEEAIKEFRRTGQHLGVFDSPVNATAYAQQVHQDQAAALDGYLSTDPHAGEPAPDFKSSNARGAGGNVEVDPNTVGTFASHLASQLNPMAMVRGAASVLPIPKALGGSGVDAPLRFVQHSVFPTEILLKAKDSLKQGDYVTAARHFIDYVLPVIGPALEHPADEMQQGKYAAGLGDAVGLGTTLFGAEGFANLVKGVKAGPKVAKAKPAIEFANTRGIPVDAATASDNLAVKGVQALADRSIGGSLVATPARAAQADAMTRVGGELAADAHPTAMMPEQAGESLRTALTAKSTGHTQAANAAYDAVRKAESPATAVNLAPVKTSITPIVEQMKRQMPLTQQQANPGLKALENILNGPDSAPLSQIDRDLSAIKTVAREQGGLAKFAVAKLEAAVSDAALRGGPAVADALNRGRAATVAKYQTEAVLDKLHAEPVKAINALTAPKDAAIQRLRAVTQQVPAQTSEIARAYLEDLLTKPNRVAEWNKLGTRTKAILFPKSGQSAALDQFFALTKRISDTNVNPSGSGYVAALGAQGAMLWYDPLHAIPMQISGLAMAKLLRSPTALNVLTRGLTLPASAPVAMRAAATAKLLQAARDAGAELAPAGADQGSGQSSQGR